MAWLGHAFAAAAHTFSKVGLLVWLKSAL
jgi:hypothetical protein